MARVAWLAGGFAVLCAAAALVWLLALRDSAEPVPVDEVVAAADDGGVYLYRTRGSEEIDALVGSRHTYPSETALTVTTDGDCVSYRWDALRDRSTTWDVCRTAGGVWELRGYRETHRFFGQTELTEYRCDPGSVWRPAEAKPGTTFSRTCSTSDTTETGNGRVVAADADGQQLRIELTLEGRTRGTGSLELWLRPDDGLPIRVELENDNASDTPIGDVRYVESVELELSANATS